MIIDKLLEIGADYLGGDFFARIKDKRVERAKRTKRDKNVQAVIDRILSDEKSNQNYDALLKTIDNSKIVSDLISAIDNGSIKTIDFGKRVEYTMNRMKLSAIEKNYVRGVMLKIYNEVLTVMQKTESAAERRMRNELQIEENRTREFIDEKLDKITNILENNKADIDDADYAAFESSIIGQYLNGNIPLIQKILLILPKWERNGQARLPIRVRGLFEFMKVISNCYVNGYVDLNTIDDCLNCNVSLCIKELIMSIVFAYGKQGDSDRLLDKYGKTHLSDYAQLLSTVKREYIPMEEIIAQNEFVQLWAVLAMFNINNVDIAYRYLNFFKNAENMLPKSVIEARYIIIREAHYVNKYVLCTNMEKVSRELDSIIFEYIQLHSFFDDCEGMVKEKYYIEFAKMLTDASNELVEEWNESVFKSLNQEAYKIALKGYTWRSNSSLISEKDFENYFGIVQNERDTAIPINLLYAAYLTLGADFVKDFLKKRMFLLEQNIHYLRLALEAGMDREIIDEYETHYNKCPEFYILKAIYQTNCISSAEEDVFSGNPDSKMQAMQLMEIAVNKFIENGIIHIFSLLPYLINASVLLGRFAELADKILPIESIVVKRLLAQKYYEQLKDVQSARKLISEVIESDAVSGKDYALLGNMCAMDQEAIEVYETGYTLFCDLGCLYNLLHLQYNHNTIELKYLEAASKVNDVMMQNLVSFCYGRIGVHDKEKDHAIKALLLCNQYIKEIYGHFTKIEIDQSGREMVDYVGEDTYIALRDPEGSIRRFCFYRNKDVLPDDGIMFADAQHFFADLNENTLYSRLYRHEAGDTVLLEDNAYTISELGDVGGFLLRECLSKLASEGDVVQFQGEINQTLEKLTKYLIDDNTNAEKLLSEYRDLSRFPSYSYMYLSNRFSCSYISLLNKFSISGPFIRSMNNDEMLAAKEYVIGLDTVFLLSKLELSMESYKRICSCLIMSETSYKLYQQGKADDYRRHDRSAGYMGVIENRPIITQVDHKDVNKELNELYGPIDQVIQLIPRKGAIFTCPNELEEIKEKIVTVIGQEIADGLQLTTTENVVIIDDALVACVFNALYRGKRWGTIMNLLAHVDLSIHEMISCLSKLSKNKYISVFVLDFFEVLLRKFDDLKKSGDLDAYEKELTYFIEVFSDLINEKVEHGNFVHLMKILTEKYPMNDIIVHMIVEWLNLYGRSIGK